MQDGTGHQDPGPRPIITGRLMLKPPGEEERDMIVDLAAHPAISGNLAAAPGNYARVGGRSLAVISRSIRTTIGVTGFGPMADRAASVEVSTWIGEPYWERGYATEATQAVVDLAFAATDIEALWCSNRASNRRGRRVIEKCGFQFCETGMARSPVTMGAIPVERFLLERRNWASLKSWGATDRENDRVPRETAV